MPRATCWWPGKPGRSCSASAARSRPEVPQRRLGPPGVRGADALVDRQGLAQQFERFGRPAAVQLAPAEAFQGPRLLQGGGHTLRDGQGLLITWYGVRAGGERQRPLAEIIEGFGLAEP